MDLHVEEELLVPKDEPQDVEQPHEEVHGVVGNTHAEPSIRNGRRRTTEGDRLRLDAAKNVGAPTSQCKQRQSPDRFTGYMDLMRKCIVTEHLPFKNQYSNQPALKQWWRSMTPLSITVHGR